MKKMMLGCGAALLMAFIAAVGLGYFGYVKVTDWNTGRKARIYQEKMIVEKGIAQRRRYLESGLPEQTRDVVPLEFYSYDGFRDWWRMPLVFPYQLMCIDTQDKASLEKFDASKPVSDPNRSSSSVLGDITRAITDNSILVFEANDGGMESYGIFQYRTGKVSMFSNQKQMWTAAKNANFSGSLMLSSVEDLFGSYYDYKKNFAEQSRSEGSER